MAKEMLKRDVTTNPSTLLYLPSYPPSAYHAYMHAGQNQCSRLHFFYGQKGNRQENTYNERPVDVPDARKKRQGRQKVSKNDGLEGIDYINLAHSALIAHTSTLKLLLF